MGHQIVITIESYYCFSGERVLDLGCGDGTLAAKLSGLGCTVTGVDSSPEMVAEAKARGVDAFVLDGHDLRSRYTSGHLCAEADEDSSGLSFARQCVLYGVRWQAVEGLWTRA